MEQTLINYTDSCLRLNIPLEQGVSNYFFSENLSITKEYNSFCALIAKDSNDIELLTGQIRVINETLSNNIFVNIADNDNSKICENVPISSFDILKKSLVRFDRGISFSKSFVSVKNIQDIQNIDNYCLILYFFKQQIDYNRFFKRLRTFEVKRNQKVSLDAIMSQADSFGVMSIQIDTNEKNNVWLDLCTTDGKAYESMHNFIFWSEDNAGKLANKSYKRVAFPNIDIDLNQSFVRNGNYRTFITFIY